MDDIGLAVQKMYDEVGEYFSKTREKTYGRNSANWLMTQHYLENLQPGAKILDLGCGNGRLLSGLTEEIQYLGIDFSKTLLEIAKRKYPQRKFLQGDITREKTWADLKKEFAAVFCIATLHHIPTQEEQVKVLRAIKKVIRPGGFLYLTVWNLKNERLKRRKLEKKKIQVGKMVEMSFAHSRGRFVMVMDKEYLMRLLEEAGWIIEKCGYIDRGGTMQKQGLGENLLAVAR